MNGVVIPVGGQVSLSNRADLVREGLQTADVPTVAGDRRSYVILCLGIIALCATLPIIAWGQFLFPIGDDLECAAWQGGWKTLYQVPLTFWYSWGGCYSAIFFRVLYSAAIKHGVFWATPLVFVILHFTGATAALLLFGVRSKLTAITVGVIWTLCYFASMPSPAETTFWATGMVVYEPGNILALLLTVLAFRPQTTVGAKRFELIALWALVPIVVGCHFTFALWTVAVLGLRAWERGRNWQDGLLFLWALVFLVLVFAAPGNFQRYSVRMEETAVTASYVVTRSIGSFVEFVVRELSLVQNWLWLALGVLATSHQGSAEANGGRIRTNLLMRLTAVVLPLLGVFVLSAMTREVPPPLRVQNSVHYLLVVGIVVLIWPVLANCYRPKAFGAGTWLVESKFFERAAGLSLCLAIVSPNYVRCVRELVTVGAEYKQYWHEVEKRVAEAKNKKIDRVVIPANPERRPLTVFHPSFLGGDPQAWPNKNYAKFFGVAEVVATDSQ